MYINMRHNIIITGIPCGTCNRDSVFFEMSTHALQEGRKSSSAAKSQYIVKKQGGTCTCIESVAITIVICIWVGTCMFCSSYIYDLAIYHTKHIASDI